MKPELYPLIVLVRSRGPRRDILRLHDGRHAISNRYVNTRFGLVRGSALPKNICSRLFVWDCSSEKSGESEMPISPNKGYMMVRSSQFGRRAKSYCDCRKFQLICCILVVSTPSLKWRMVDFPAVADAAGNRRKLLLAVLPYPGNAGFEIK